jgi:UDP-N-acetylenolpyruvoylglucosamine reductase
MPASPPISLPADQPAAVPAGVGLAELGRALRACLSEAAVVRENEPLARRTTLRVGGRADLYVEPASEADLAAVLRLCAARARPWRVLGRGSNLLVRDGGVRGVVVCLAQPAFRRIEVRETEIHAGAGARLKDVAVEAQRHSLAGLEFLEGIPGSVGGALRMNAGAYQAWTFAVLERVRLMTPAGEAQERPAAEVPASYRSCPIFATHIALGAVFRGRPDRAAAIRERMDGFSRRRWQTQPREPSAGCIFKNPPAIAAGKLVEELGLKGVRMGGAKVSEAHGNFIVNTGGATARDILELIRHIQAEARARRGIELETEVEILGED